MPSSGILDFMPAPNNTDKNENDHQQPKMIFHICLYSLKLRIISRQILTTLERTLWTWQIMRLCWTISQSFKISNSGKEIINKASKGQHKSKTRSWGISFPTGERIILSINCFNYWSNLYHTKNYANKFSDVHISHFKKFSCTKRIY